MNKSMKALSIALLFIYAAAYSMENKQCAVEECFRTIGRLNVEKQRLNVAKRLNVEKQRLLREPTEFVCERMKLIQEALISCAETDMYLVEYDAKKLVREYENVIKEYQNIIKKHEQKPMGLPMSDFEFDRLEILSAEDDDLSSEFFISQSDEDEELSDESVYSLEEEGDTSLNRSIQRVRNRFDNGSSGEESQGILNLEESQGILSLIDRSYRPECRYYLRMFNNLILDKSSSSGRASDALEVFNNSGRLGDLLEDSVYLDMSVDMNTKTRSMRLKELLRNMTVGTIALGLSFGFGVGLGALSEALGV